MCRALRKHKSLKTFGIRLKNNKMRKRCRALIIFQMHSTYSNIASLIVDNGRKKKRFALFEQNSNLPVTYKHVTYFSYM